MNAIDNSQTQEQLNAILGAAGIGYEVTYVGFQKKEEGRDKPWVCDQWKVSFLSGGDGRGPRRVLMTAEYFTGLGHRKKEKRFASLGAAQMGMPQKPPSAGVLYSLLLDATALDTSFPHWCSEYGYDEDSMKAFETYKACCDIGQKINKTFPRDVQDKLREVLQDY